MELWRISNFKSLLGEGGLRASGRWHTAGRRIVYLAESPAGALLEVLVHLDFMGAPLPEHYNLLRITCADPIQIADVAGEQGSARWNDALHVSQQLGDAWIDEGLTALAHVPSSIVPHTKNYLLNPVHADAAKVAIAEVIPTAFDKRLMRNLRI